MTDHYFYNKQPLVVEGKTIAYALFGAQELYKKAGSPKEQADHYDALRSFQALLRTFQGSSDENL
jgi:hypothetical protein